MSRQDEPEMNRATGDGGGDAGAAPARPRWVLGIATALVIGVVCAPVYNFVLVLLMLSLTRFASPQAGGGPFRACTPDVACTDINWAMAAAMVLLLGALLLGSGWVAQRVGRFRPAWPWRLAIAALTGVAVVTVWLLL